MGSGDATVGNVELGVGFAGGFEYLPVDTVVMVSGGEIGEGKRGCGVVGPVAGGFVVVGVKVGEAGESAIGKGGIGRDAGVKAVKENDGFRAGGPTLELDGDVVDVEGGEVLPEHHGVGVVGAGGLNEQGISVPVVFGVVDDAILFFGSVAIAGKVPEKWF